MTLKDKFPEIPLASQELFVYLPTENKIVGKYGNSSIS
jgi:hypothetical protein